MQDFITAYLIQERECSLTGIGHFRITTHPATSDVADRTMLPPYNEVTFLKNVSEKEDVGLIKYFAAKQGLDEVEARKQLKLFFISLSNNLSFSKTASFPSLGKLEKDGNGNITFHQENNITLLEPVKAERVIHENAKHPILVGDKEIISEDPLKFKEPEIPLKREWWKIAALILFIISVCIVLLQYYYHGLESGNQSKLFPRDIPATYK